MKRLLVALLFLSSYSFATAFTQAASGEWYSATTWGTTAGLGCHVTYPCGTDVSLPGDTVTTKTGATLYCDSGHICSGGSSPNNNTTSWITTPSGFVSLTICGTAAIGPCSGGTAAQFVSMQRFSMTNGTFILYPGGTNGRVFVDCTWQTTGCTASASVYYTFEIISPALWSSNGNTNPCTTASNICHVTYEGDSSLDTSGLKNGSSLCITDSCVAGTLGASSGAVTLAGLGTFTNSAVHGFAGSTISGRAFNGVAFEMSSGSVGYTVTGNDFNHNGFVMGYTTGGSGNVVWDNWIHDCKFSTNTGQGCFYTLPGSTGGTQTFGGVVQGDVTSGTITATTATYKNLMVTADPGAGAAASSGIKNADSGTYDGLFEYWNWWNTGTTLTASVASKIPTQNLKNSVIWVEALSSMAGHLVSWQAPQLGYAGGAMTMTNNYHGALGFAQLYGSQTAGGGGGAPVAANSTETMSGNVEGPGPQGWASGNYNQFFLSTATASGTVSYNVRNNLGWSSLPSTLSAVLSLTNQWGAFAAESAGLYTGIVAEYQKNVFLRTDGIGVGPTPKICDSTTNATYNGIIPDADHNAVYNCSSTVSGCNSGVPQICTNNPGWVSGDSGTHDVYVPDKMPPLNNMWPSLPTFDVSYGYPSGFLNGGTPTTAATYWSADSNWQGAWTNGTSYTAGQIVSDTQTAGTTYTVTSCAVSGSGSARTNTITVSGTPPTSIIGRNALFSGLTSCTGLNLISFVVNAVSGSTLTVDVYSLSNASGASSGTVTILPTYGGATTYWRCKANHTASGFNRPITGSDLNSNPWLKPEWWEEAWIQPFKDMILSSTSSNLWTDGAIGAASYDPVHVLNAWLTYVSVQDPAVWGACNGSDCGPSRASVQRIPPIMSVN